MRDRYFWHGHPVKIEHILVKVKPLESQPLKWYNYNCLTSGCANSHVYFFALEILTKTGVKFIICNEHGLGINKLRKGGLINQTHQGFNIKSIVKIIREGSQDWNRHFLPRKRIHFDEKGYSTEENERRLWQRVYYPEAIKEREQYIKGIQTI